LVCQPVRPEYTGAVDVFATVQSFLICHFAVYGKYPFIHPISREIHCFWTLDVPHIVGLITEDFT